MKEFLRTSQTALAANGLLLVNVLIFPVLFNITLGTWDGFLLLTVLAQIVMLFALQQLYFLFTACRALCLIHSFTQWLVVEAIYLLLAVYVFITIPSPVRYLVILEWLIVHTHIVGLRLFPLLPPVVFAGQLLLSQVLFQYALGGVTASRWPLLASFCLLLASHLIIGACFFTIASGMRALSLVLGLGFFVLGFFLFYQKTSFSLLLTLVVVGVSVLTTLAVPLLFLLKRRRAHAN